MIMYKILFGSANDFYLEFVKEDGPVENFTAIFYFLSALLSVLMGIGLIKQKKIHLTLLYLLLSIAFFFIAFEEISWGQRIFSTETPEYFIDNEQNEMNFHNLPIINHFKMFSIILVTLVGFFLWAIFTHHDKLNKLPFTKFFVPEGFVMSYFISVWIFYFIQIFQKFLPPSSEGLYLFIFSVWDNEIFEFLLSVGILIFITSKIIYLNNQKKMSKLDS